jgi:hypothetical protein
MVREHVVLKEQKHFRQKIKCVRSPHSRFSVLEGPEQGSDMLFLSLTPLKPGLLCLLMDPEEEAEAEVL